MAHRVVPRNDTVFLNTLRRTIMVAMIPLVSMSLCLFLFHFWQTLTAADEANINILYKDAKIMDQTLDNLHRSLNYSAQDPSVVGFSMRPYIQDTERDIQLLAMLKNLEKSYPFIHESDLYSPHENRQLSSTGSIVSAAPEWLSRMSEASCTLPNGLLGWMGRGTAAAQDLYLAAAVPMESSDPAGYVVLRIDFGQFAQDSLELEEQDSNSATYIFSDDYGLLYSTKNAMDLSQWADEIFGISSGSSALKLLGGALLHCTTLRSEGLGWTYVYTSPAFPTSALLALLVPILVSILTAIGIGLWLAYQNSKELYRPLGQTALHRSGWSSDRFGSRTLEGFGAGAWTAAGQNLRHRLGQLLLSCLDGGLIIGSCLTLDDADGVHRTGWQTVAQSVAVVVADQLCFAVHHGDGSLVAGFGTQTTAVAFFLVNRNNFADHV